MSEFGNFLRHQLDIRRARNANYTHGQFAQDLGLTKSMLSRFFSGESQSCNPKTLTRICATISDDPFVQAKAQVAYLRDQRVEPGRALVNVGVAESTRVQEDPADIGIDAILAESALDNKTVSAVRHIIIQCKSSRRLVRMVQDLGELAANEL